MKLSFPTSLAAIVLVGLVHFGRAEEPTRLPLRGDEIKKRLTTEFYGISMGGKKVGWIQDEMKLLAGPDPVYVCKSRMIINIVSAGAKMQRSVDSVLEFDGHAPYAFRGGIDRMTDGKVGREIVLKRTKQRFEAIIRVDGKEFQKTIPAIDYTLSDRLSTWTWLRQGAKPGDCIVTNGFNFDDLAIELTRIRLTAKSQTLLHGRMVPCQEVESCNVGEKVSALECYDPKTRRMLVATVPGVMDIQVEDEKTAKIVEDAPDLFEKTKIRFDRPVGEPSSITGLILETIGGRDLGLVNQPCQEVRRKESGEFILKLGKLGPGSVKADPQEIAAALKETGNCPISHPKVRELARKAVGDAKSPREKVERLVHFVNHFITYDLNSNPMTVDELIAVRKGKCVDFAALFTTLARAEGIPAREASGLYYTGDRAQLVAGHAWNDVALDGRWVGVDPTADEVELDAMHIQFDESPVAVAARGLTAFHVVKVEYANQRYQSRQGTFALQLPPGSWRQMGESLNPAAEVAYVHKSGEAFCMVIAEQHYVPLLNVPLSMTLSQLKKAFVAHIMSVDPKAKIIREETKKIQGHDALVITLELTAAGQRLSYEVLLYSDGATTIQLFTWTGQARFADLKGDLDSLLNGLVIPAKPEEVADKPLQVTRLG